MNNKREEIPYDEDGKQLSFYTDAETVYVDRVPLKTYLEALESKLTSIAGGHDGDSFFGFQTDYAKVSDENNNLEYVKTLATWSSTSPALDTAHPHLWKRIKSKKQDPVGTVVVTNTDYLYCGSLGQTGMDAEWKEWIFRLTDSNKSEEEIRGTLKADLDSYYSENSSSAFQLNDFIPPYWKDDMLSTTDAKPLLWCASRYKSKGKWSKFDNVHIFGKKPLDGVIVNNIYTIVDAIDPDKWDSATKNDKDTLLSTLTYDKVSGKIPLLLTPLKLNYTWYDFVPNAKSDEIVYQVAVYFQESECVGLDSPIRITGPAGVGSDGNGVEFIYCALDHSDPEEGDFPELILGPDHYNSSVGGWKDTAAECGISATTPYQFVRQRIGQYTDENNWYWQASDGNKYGKSPNLDVKPVEQAPANWNYGWSKPIMWSSWGVDGVDGDGIQYIFLRLTENEYQFVTASKARWNFDGEATTEGDLEITQEEYPVTIFHVDEQIANEHWIAQDVTKPWTDNPSGVDVDYPYEFCCSRVYSYIDSNDKSLGKAWKPWSIDNIALWSHFGEGTSPYLVILGNPQESIYTIEKEGSVKDSYIILDKDGVTTGEIIMSGGVNKSENYSLPIDKVSILDYTGTSEYNFDGDGILTVDLGENWNCRFKLTEKNGNPVINLIGIGPSPSTTVALPEGINSKDLCFRGNLQGKYQKKIVILAENSDKNLKLSTTWTISAIHDRNGNGVYRYRIMPNIDRIVKTAYFKRFDGGSLLISSVYNVGNSSTLSFDVEKDSYGKTWRNVNGDQCKVVIKDNLDQVLVLQEGTTSPITISSETLVNLIDRLSNIAPNTPLLIQCKVELQVVDPDYDDEFLPDFEYNPPYNKYSTVDKCNLLLEYIVSEAGKDGKDGLNGAASMFNLSNDSGSFAYNYKEGTVVLNTSDNSTDIQYSENSSFKCCTSLKLGEGAQEREFNTSGSGIYGKIHYTLTKGSDYWHLLVNSIDDPGKTGSYDSTLPIPIKGFVDGTEVGSATFKMTGVKDLNEDGVYTYRLAVEHPYASLDSSNMDTLDINVYRDSILEGKGYNTAIPVLILVELKGNGEVKEITTDDEDQPLTISCANPIINLNTDVTLKTIQEQKGAIVKVFVQDDDYFGRPERIANNGLRYYYTNEYEEISYTVVPEVTDEDLQKAMEGALINTPLNTIYNFTGLAARIRTWSKNDNYFPIISSVEELSEFSEELLTSGLSIDDDEIAIVKVGEKNYYYPRFYDMVYWGQAEDMTPMYKALKFSCPIEGYCCGPADGEHWTQYWEQAQLYDFISANSAYIKKLAADLVTALQFLVLDTYKDEDDKDVPYFSAGLINGEDVYDTVKRTNTDLGEQQGDSPVVFFSGLPPRANFLEDASFTIKRDGTTKVTGDINAKTFGFIDETGVRLAKFKYFSYIKLGETSYTNTVLLGIRTDFDNNNDDDEEYSWLPLSLFISLKKDSGISKFNYSIKLRKATLNEDKTAIETIGEEVTLYYDTFGTFYDKLYNDGATEIRNLENYVIEAEVMQFAECTSPGADVFLSNPVTTYIWAEQKLPHDDSWLNTIPDKYICETITAMDNFTINETTYRSFYGMFLSAVHQLTDRSMPDRYCAKNTGGDQEYIYDRYRSVLYSGLSGNIVGIKRYGYATSYSANKLTDSMLSKQANILVRNAVALL